MTGGVIYASDTGQNFGLTDVMRSRIGYVLIATSFVIFIVLLEQRALFIGVDCLSFQYNLWKN